MTFTRPSFASLETPVYEVHAPMPEWLRFVVTAEAVRVGEEWMPRGTEIELTFAESQTYLAGSLMPIPAGLDAVVEVTQD